MRINPFMTDLSLCEQNLPERPFPEHHQHVEVRGSDDVTPPHVRLHVIGGGRGGWFLADGQRLQAQMTNFSAVLHLNMR